MAEAATRVALLARPGDACERLEAALREAGADLVLVVDPTSGEVDAVQQSGAQAVLVALDPSVEDALDRFDALLGDPAMTVIYDEAELAAQREGWDAARWVRHLAAKLRRADDVLPPRAASDLDVGFEVPSGHAPGMLNLHQYGDSGSEDAEAIAPFVAMTLDDHAAGHDDTLDVDALGIGDLALEFEALAAAADNGARRGPDFGALELPGEAPQHATGTAPTLALDDIEIAQSVEPDERSVDHRFHRDLHELSARIATLELVDAPRTVKRLQGAVIVLAGIGGPDAVRQLLSGLPPKFVRPVVIQQRLDGARHDKLVRQMQRATAMPVHLAETGIELQPGNIYVLPESLGIEAIDDALRFADGADLFANVPAGDSAAIVLSGTDPAMSDAVMALSWGGAFVAGQVPEGCYDAAAAEAVIARGAENGTPAALAKRLAQRWPA